MASSTNTDIRAGSPAYSNPLNIDSSTNSAAPPAKTAKIQQITLSSLSTKYSPNSLITRYSPNDLNELTEVSPDKADRARSHLINSQKKGDKSLVQAALRSRSNSKVE